MILKNFSEFANSYNENFTDWLSGSTEQGEAKTKKDDPNSGVMTKTVDEYYKDLQDYVDSGKSMAVQKMGSMQYSKMVEDIQLALDFLGYKLPKYGVDGFFGPETANALIQFNSATAPKIQTVQND